MKTIHLTLFKFIELEVQAKQNALEKLREINVDDSDWYEYIFDSFSEMSAHFGIAVDPKEISFSGFYAHGDGSCFDAEIDLPKLLIGFSGDPQNLKYEPPFEISEPQIDPFIVRRIVDGSISSSVTIKRFRGNALIISTEFNCNSHLNNEYPGIELELEDLKIWIADVLFRLNKYFYDCLTKVYEYLTSDESVRQTLQANEYLFTNDGAMANHLLELESRVGEGRAGL